MDVLNEVWSANQLEKVSSCPYCLSNSHHIELTGVHDWSFFTAPGSWTFRRCDACASLFLDERIKPSYVHIAYAAYYTHDAFIKNNFLSQYRVFLKNEWMSQISGCNFQPRIKLLGAPVGLLARLINKKKLPFGIDGLSSYNRGLFLDYGCGSGYYLSIAQSLGWKSYGVDFDSEARSAAKKRGMEVYAPDDGQLERLDTKYDLILCSHVLEHVYNPVELLNKFYALLNSGGRLLISLPNSQSPILQIFGIYWRGLEAPRHVAIPSKKILVEVLTKIGFDVSDVSDLDMETISESIRMRRRAPSVSLRDKIYALFYRLLIKCTKLEPDTIKLVCRRL